MTETNSEWRARLGVTTPSPTGPGPYRRGQTPAETAGQPSQRELQRTERGQPGGLLLNPNTPTPTPVRTTLNRNAGAFNSRVATGVTTAREAQNEDAREARAFAQRYVDSGVGRTVIEGTVRARERFPNSPTTRYPGGVGPGASYPVRYEAERQAEFDRQYQTRYRQLREQRRQAAAAPTNAETSNSRTRTANTTTAAARGGGGGGGTGRTATSRDRPNRTPVGRPVDDPTPVETDTSTPRITITGAGVTQAFSISSFRSEIAENDVLPSHSYLVTFAPFRSGYFENAPLTDFVTNKRNTLLLRCENVVLPTPSLLEEENIRRYGYGPVEKVPYGVQFSDVTLTWIVDKNSELIDFMHQWMNTIVMHDAPNTLMNISNDSGEKRAGLVEYAPFEVGYKDAYANPIVRVYVYNKQQQTVTEYEMYDVFPMNIQSMNLSWGETDQYQKLTVTFAYTNMRVKAPLKSSEAQFNYISLSVASANEERQQEEDRGGRAAADAAEAPLNEFITRAFNTSLPGTTRPTANQVPAVLASPTLEVRDFTTT